MDINIKDYLSNDEIKEIVVDELRNQIKDHFKDEDRAARLLSNFSYKLIYDEIDKTIPNSRQLIESKTKEILLDIKSYSVFRNSSYGQTPSPAHKIMEQAVTDNKDLINGKVKETIINKDYSEEIWNKFEDLADSFTNNIYSILELGRNKKN